MPTKYEEHMKKMRELINPPPLQKGGTLEKLKEVARRKRVR